MALGDPDAVDPAGAIKSSYRVCFATLDGSDLEAGDYTTHRTMVLTFDPV